MSDPILVGLELSGRFVEIIIDLMQKYPDEWSVIDGKIKENSYNLLPTLKHTGGTTIQLWARQASAGGFLAIEEQDLEATIISPAQIPAFGDVAGKKLGGACVKLYKYLILKSLGYERLLKEDEDA